MIEESGSKYTYTMNKSSTYVILKNLDLCQCSLNMRSWYLEANIAYCTQESSNGVDFILYSQHGYYGIPL